LQLITVEELVKGAQIDYPRIAGANQSFKQAQRANAEKVEHGDLFSP
jgi:hypothetical protein